MPFMSAPRRPLDEQRLRRAVRAANLPTLAMVTFQLTGDPRWLDEPYRPMRSSGLGPNDSGGLSTTAAAELRAAAVEAITKWSRGAAPAVPDPDPDLLRQMLSISMGEAVPEEYEPLMREEMGFAPDPGPAAVAPAVVAERDLCVVIIGAGISGLVAGWRLQKAGVPFTILERNHEVGGVWLTNTYPGAGVDTPSYLYSFSFFPWNWSTHFGKRDEVAAYVAAMADHFDLRKHIEFGVSVDSATWDEHGQRWTVTAGSRSWTASAVISAVGLFNNPKIPDLPGMATFRGPIFHSAQWPSDVDLAGKRVAVIGTGASAMQIVPAIADRTAHLSVFQRSPQWVAPNAEYFAEVGEDVHWLMEHVPYYHAWYRFRLAWVFNDRVHPSLQIDEDWEHPDQALNAVNDGHRRYFTRYLEEQLDGRPDLVEKCLPDYPPFGKRMLLDNGWFAALRRDDVELVTDGVARITETGVVTDAARHYEVDVVVLCTGFDVHHYLPGIEVLGRGGLRLHEVWGEDDALAHLGITVPGFPNFFLMYGPNTNSGAGGSFIFVAEAQGRYIVDLITSMARDGIGALECRPEALQRWVTEIDARHRRMVWSHPGMTTYYRNSRGRVVTNSPYRVVDYWAMTRAPELADFQATPLTARSST